MTQREKLLVGAVASLVVLWVLWTCGGWYLTAADRLETQLRQTESDAMDAEQSERLARRSLRRLEELQARSLPADSDIARSVYSAWLVGAIEEAGLDFGDVRFSATRSLPGVYDSIAFNAEATGSLEAVAKFLHAYHTVGCLHQLSKLQIAPIDDSGEALRLSLTSVALIVTGTELSEGLPEVADASRLARDAAEAYAESLVSRNMFASYTPPPPPKPPAPPPTKPRERQAPPPFDHAEHAYLTGVVETGAGLQAWINVRTTGEVLRLVAGDDLKVGELEGRVQAVTQRAIVVESDGESWTTPLGEPLRQKS